MKNKAFTLVELSIVLVILGLLLGGVIGGQSLVKSAELRNITTSFNLVKTATINFQERYSALPGDMKNADTYWGLQNATPATCQKTPSTTALTCDGDGSGAIDQDYELYRYWQQLANAGLVTGMYSGIGGATAASGGTGSVPGTNTYPLRRQLSGMSVFYWSDAYVTACGANCTGTINQSNMHIFIAGATSTSNQMGPSIVTPQEAMSIDTKIDDGLPSTGIVFADNATHAPGCVGGANPAYLVGLADSFTAGSWSSGCRLMFIPGF